MGKIVTKGSCEKEYEAEIMEITVTFSEEGSDTRFILEGVQEQCEQFLKELSAIGINPESVQFEDSGIQSAYKEDRRAERSLTLRTKVNVKLCTYICSLLRKHSNEIRYRISYDVENKGEKSRELLQLAVEDSRRQADIIAAALGKTVSGVESVNDEEYRHRDCLYSMSACYEGNPEIPEAFASDTPLTDRASLPTVTMSEQVTVSWTISN